MPPITVVKGSKYNIDPEGKYWIDDYTKLDVLNSGVPLKEKETEVIPRPFIQVPLNIMEGAY
jgi:magnesium chelatase subunit D